MINAKLRIFEMDKFEEYYKNSEWFGTYESDLMMKEAYEAGQQSQQAKVEELQEEFAEDERFLKEQIKDKDLKIENLEYLQGMDKELIQTLQSKSEELQNDVSIMLNSHKRMSAGLLQQQSMIEELIKEREELQNRLKQAYEDIDTFAEAHKRECEFKAQFAKEKAELQKRVDSIKQLIQDYLSEEKELELKEWEQSTIYGRIAIELEQSLKGGG